MEDEELNQFDERSTLEGEKNTQKIATLPATEFFQDLQCEKIAFEGSSPSPCANHIAAIFENTIMLLGGLEGSAGSRSSGLFLIDIQDYPKVRGTSLRLEENSEDFPLNRVGASSTHVGDALYIFGGWDGKTYVEQGFLIHLPTMSLVIEDHKNRGLPPPRRDHTMTLIGDRCFVFGGWSPNNYDNGLFMVDDHWRWARVEASGARPCARRGHTASALGQKLYVFGGLCGCTRYLNDLYVLDSYQMTWKKIETENKPTPRAFHTATVVDKYIVIFGGTSGRLSFYDDMWVFDVERVEWTEINISGLPQVCSHTATLVSQDSSIFIACGLTPEANSEGDANTLKPSSNMFRVSWSSLESESGGATVKSESENEEHNIDAKRGGAIRYYNNFRPSVTRK